ncbi:MAG: tetratricopeptide repeat protein [Gemmataceae bacterium]
MSKDWTAPFVPECEATLSAVLAEYLEAVDRGEKPDREALLARHPLLAERLRAYFTDQDRIDAFAEPLRSHGAAEAAGLAYELLDEISRGGMGVVIRCRDRTLDRNLAIKVLLDRFRDRPDMVRRFVEEARITGRLQHPFIVPVHKLGALPDGRPYFAMKLVEGRTLAELLRDRPGPEQERTRFLKVFEQVCQTIAYAHSNGVIHRDLKPANIMVGAFGEVQVMDWGLAKVLADVAEDGEDRPAEAATHDTQAGAVLGTYAYMPPEQAGGMVERVSRPSDVFGLGAILCEILTGSPPYRGERTEVAAQARAGATEEALAWLDGSGADTELIQLARRCLRADPAERPADAAAVADAMARYFALAQERMRAAEIARAKAETEATEERKRLILAEAKVEAEEKRHRAERRRRRSTALLAAALLLLLVFGAAFGFWYQREQSTRVAEAATRQRVTERDVAAALAEVALRHEEGLKHVDNPERWKRDLTSAWDAWKRADNALGLGNADDDLRARVADARVILEQDERDRNLFATLERLWLERAGLSPEDVRAPRDAGAFFLAFKEYGLDLEALDPEEVAARLAKHPHRVRLGDEINIVAQVQADLGGKRTKLAQATFKGVLIQPPDWGKAQRLTRVLDRLDPDPDSFGSRWRAARVKGDTKTLIELARSPEAHGRSPRGCTALAHDLMAVKALPEAGDLLRAAHDRHPTDFWLNQVLGVVSLTDVAAGDVEAAKESLRYLTAALAARGNNAATQIVLSNVYKFLGKNKEAFRAANAAIEADSRSAPAYHNLGALHFSLAEWDKALAAFTKAADLDDRSPLPHDSLGQTYAAKLDFDAAIRHYKIALKRDPAFAGCYVNLGNALVAKNDIDGAIEKYHKALEIFPSYALAHFNLANALAKNNVKGALKSLEDTLVCDPDYAPALYAKGKLLLLYARDIPGAIACYQKVVDLHPKAPNAHFRMADLLQGLGRHAQAEASLRTLISLDQRYPEAHARLGIALAARGAWDEASAAYETALEQDKLPLEQKAVVLDSLGTVLLNKGDFEGAVKKHRAALALDTRRGLVAYNLGTAQMALGALEDAAESFADAVKQDARNPMFHLRLAMVRLHLKDLDQAIASAKEAVALAPGMAEAHNVLAQAYFDNLQFAEGLKALQQAKGQVRPADPGQNLLQAAYQAGEGLMKVDQVLPAFLRGDARAAESLPKTTLALITAAKHKRYLAAYRLYVDAFAAQPALAENLIAGCRAHAAGAAIRAATGDAEKDAKLDDAERARLRAQALAWLSAELDAWKRASPLVPAPEKGMARFRVRRWLVEADLAKVRDPEALKSLPALERDAWTKLWKDVAAFGSGAKGPVGPDLARLRKLAEFPSESLLFNVGYDGGSATATAFATIPWRRSPSCAPSSKAASPMGPFTSSSPTAMAT